MAQRIRPAPARPGPAGAVEQGRWRAPGLVLVRSRRALVGVGIVVVIVVFCFLGPVFWPTNQVSTDLAQATLAPSAAHPLGTDGVGYDVLGRLMLGGQSSIEVGLAVAMLSTLIGTAWGAVAGYLGGVVDAVMMRVVDALLSIPALVMLLVVVNLFKPTTGLLILVLSLVSWLVPARLVRGETLSLRVRDYVQAVRAMGGGRTRILARHIVPNAVGTVMVNASFQVADAILTLATLSYLGLGLPPPAASWGGILSNGLSYLNDGYWWLVYPAGAAIVAIVVAFNFIGDALRDALDVRLQGR